MQFVKTKGIFLLLSLQLSKKYHLLLETRVHVTLGATTIHILKLTDIVLLLKEKI